MTLEDFTRSRRMLVNNLVAERAGRNDPQRIKALRRWLVELRFLRSRM